MNKILFASINVCTAIYGFSQGWMVLGSLATALFVFYVLSIMIELFEKK